MSVFVGICVLLVLLHIGQCVDITCNEGNVCPTTKLAVQLTSVATLIAAGRGP